MRENNTPQNQAHTICCNVKNCAHHSGEKVCTAQEITVGPHFAVSSNDTTCATFKGKN